MRHASTDIEQDYHGDLLYHQGIKFMIITGVDQ